MGTTQMGPDIVSTIAGIILIATGALSLIMLGVNLPKFLQQARTMRGFQNVVIDSVVPLDFWPGPEIQWAVGQLMTLNFSQFAYMTHHFIPDPTGQARQETIAIDGTGHVLAEVVSAKKYNVLLVLSTWFADHSVVETIFPFGADIKLPNFYARQVHASIEQAYHTHQFSVYEHSQTHGQPLPSPITDMEEFRRREDYFLAHYFQLRLNQQMNRNLMLAGASLVNGVSSLVFGIAFVVSSPWAFLGALIVIGSSVLVSSISRRVQGGSRDLQRTLRQFAQAAGQAPNYQSPSR